MNNNNIVYTELNVPPVRITSINGKLHIAWQKRGLQFKISFLQTTFKHGQNSWVTLGVEQQKIKGKFKLHHCKIKICSLPSCWPFCSLRLLKVQIDKLLKEVSLGSRRFRGTLSHWKYHFSSVQPVACYKWALWSCNRRGKMLKVVKANKYQLRAKMTTVTKRFKISPEWQLWFLDILSKHLLQSTSILAILYFYLKIPALSRFVESLYQIYSCSWWHFGNIMWKLQNRYFSGQPW